MSLNPDAVEALLVALSRFQYEHPHYVPKLEDGVIWSEDGVKPRMVVYKVVGIARAEGDSWNVTIEHVGSEGLSEESHKEAVTHVVPAGHLARSADVMTEMFLSLQGRTQSLSVIMGRPQGERRLH